MTNEQLLLPSKEAPTTFTQQGFLDYWFVNSIQIDTQASTQLTGEGSLYQAYLNACLQQEQIPLPLRTFTKRFEALLEFRFGVPSTKRRGQKGMFFPGVKPKLITSPRLAQPSRNPSFLPEKEDDSNLYSV